MAFIWSMDYLVYLAYGGEDYYNEALYSLLYYYKYHEPNDNTILLYTDNVALFRSQLPDDIIYMELTPEKIKEWKGSINFVHRVKIKVLQDAASRFQGNFLYLDTDTYFLKSIKPLFAEIANNNLIFDRCEGSLKDNTGGIAKKMRKFLKNENNFAIPSENEPAVIDETFVPWNAGIIGFNSSYANLLDKVEELTDILYSRNQLFVMEQIAFSYFFQKNNRPIAAEGYSHHYWYFKEFRGVLKHFFQYHRDKPFMQLKDEVHKIDPQILSSEKRAYKKMSFWQKQKRKFTKGRKWDIPPYGL